MKSQIVLCGRGGQGIIFTTRVVAEAAVLAGHDVLCAETHGMAQRGASVLSHVKIGGFASPLVRRGAADLAICLAPSEVEAARAFLREGGVLVADADEAASVAREVGLPRAANQVLLGIAVARAPALLPPADALRQAVAKLASAATREANVRAFDAGRRPR